MTLITVKFTSRELELLASLASDQLFRREFIDPKMPGYKSDLSEVRLGKSLVERLRATFDPASAKRAASVRIAK
jgi:hypothetical protein